MERLTQDHTACYCRAGPAIPNVWLLVQCSLSPTFPLKPQRFQLLWSISATQFPKPLVVTTALPLPVFTAAASASLDRTHLESLKHELTQAASGSLPHYPQPHAPQPLLPLERKPRPPSAMRQRNHWGRGRLAQASNSGFVAAATPGSSPAGRPGRTRLRAARRLGPHLEGQSGGTVKHFDSWLLWDTPAGRDQAQPIARAPRTQVQQIRTTPKSEKPAPIHGQRPLQHAGQRHV